MTDRAEDARDRCLRNAEFSAKRAVELRGLQLTCADGDIASAYGRIAEATETFGKEMFYCAQQMTIALNKDDNLE